MANKISQATWDTIGRYVLRKESGIENLVHNVLAQSFGRYPNLADACVNYVESGNIDPYYTQWKVQIDKWGIPTKNYQKKYVEVVSRACQYLINDYIQRHKYSLGIDTNSATPRLKLIKRKV